MEIHQSHHRTSVETPHDGRTATDLIRELRDETIHLFHQEIELGKTEISEKISRVTRNGVYAAVGAAIAFAGVVVLLLAAVAGLYVVLLSFTEISNEMAVWLSPLIVGTIVAVVGYAFIQKAMSTFKHETPVPERTVESLKQNKQWIKEKVS
jgi:xanthine/uracil permease